jgi:sensor histidine kinase YesM
VKLAEENKFNQIRLSQNRIILFGMGVMMLFLIIIGLMLINQNRIKAQQRMVILEQKLLRSQMNPHFIFNSMASIQDFILSKDPRTAANYLSRFAKLIRNILDSSLAESIPLSKEIETIEHYLSLQKVRMEDKFDFEVIEDESVEDAESRIPALLIQPFVENAIEHGIRHKPDKGKVTIAFRRQDNYLSVTVEDNGVGRTKAREFEEIKKKDHASVSTSLINERIKILNKRSKHKITLDIEDLYDDSGAPAGTRLVVRVPV